jgi:RNA polymerase sigma-70 factor (ECF subfamily)
MAQAPSDDEKLLRELARGSQAAFNACYERHQRAIYRFAWHMSANQAIAEEVTQEVFLHLISKPGNYDAGKGALGGYLLGMARNLLRRQLANAGMNVPLVDELLESESAELADESDMLSDLEHREKLEYLQKSILALPEEYREVLVLCDLEEMSYADAAVALACQPGTIASRLHRARAMLKTRLKEMGCPR